MTTSDKPVPADRMRLMRIALITACIAWTTGLGIETAWFTEESERMRAEIEASTGRLLAMTAEMKAMGNEARARTREIEAERRSLAR